MSNQSSKLRILRIVLISILILVLVCTFGWISYEGPPLFGKQHPTLHDAVGAGNIKESKAYIAEDPYLIESKDNHGELPIHHAIKYRQIDVLKFLIEAGADVDAKVARTGDTPLHYAVMTGDESSVSLLLSSGADKLQVNGQSVTPLEYAREHTYSNVDRVVELLVKP